MNISIIIPTLNEEKLISNLIDSLLNIRNGKNFNFEIIISDGGSKDKTLQYVKNKVDKIVVHDKIERQTIAEGKNKGAEIASGDVLIFFCADCRFKDPIKFFRYVVDYFFQSDYVAATFKFDVFPEEKKLSDFLFHTFYNTYVKIINKLGLGMGRGECQVIKSDVFYGLKGFDEKLTAGEDFELYRRIRKTGKVHLAFDHTIYESPRRYRKYGYFKVFKLWLINALSVLKFSKKRSEVWEEVR